MGACAILPRLIGQGRASELLYLGRSLGGEEGLAWGFFNRLHAPEELQDAASALAKEIAEGPSFAHAMTKRMLQMEWAMSVDQAIEAEAVAQALCMTTQDFRRAYDAFVAKQRPAFRGD
jgi:enoyl-CoA hydratase/carnithine racemase